MTELAYELNTILKNSLDWEELNNNVVPDFTPITGYEDQQGPFVLYSFIDSKMDIERYFLRNMLIRYYVYDTNIDRIWAISKALRDYLNVGDDVETIKTQMPVGSEFRIDTIELMSAVTSPPSIREGFVNTNNEFKIKYVLL